MSSGKYTRLSVTEQPSPTQTLEMDVEKVQQLSGKHGVSHTGTCACKSSDFQIHSDSGNHRHCHNSRLKRLLLPIIAFFLLMVGIMAIGCMSMNMSGSGTEWSLGEIFKRAAVDSTTTGQQGSFVHRKLYLIVVFVGLFLVLIAAIMLSAWCCRGAFENPLCCPCYLCACCGGLACLECIGCGLCAEGVEQM